MTATRTSTDSAELRLPGDGPPAVERPRIGLLGIMQDLYDEMLPGIAERQAAYAAELAGTLDGVAEMHVAPPAKDRAGAERALRELERADLDGLLVVMLTYGPAMRVARLLADTRLPICLANVQPVPAVTADWDMADLTTRASTAPRTRRTPWSAPAAASTWSPTTGAAPRSPWRSGAGRAPPPPSPAGGAFGSACSATP
jgi:L-arabinose isomerase